MKEIRGRPIVFWVSCAATILIILVLLGGGGALIVIGNQAMEGAPDMVIGAAIYGMGWAVISCYIGLVAYCYGHNLNKEVEKLEKEISEIRGRID